MPLMDYWIDRYRRRVMLGEFLQRAAEWLAAFLLCWGTCILSVRLFLPQLWPQVLWLAAGIIPALFGAWRLARLQRQSRMDAVTQLDQALNTGGLLMTLVEQPNVEWAERLPDQELVWRQAIPKLRPKRFASYLLLPLIFAIAAGFVPLRAVATTKVQTNVAGAAAAKQLEELLAAMDESAVIEEETRVELEREVAKLKEESQDLPFTQEKWEAVDALQERMQAQLENTAATMSKLEHSAEMLARPAQAGDELTSEQQLRLEKDVAESLQKLMQKGAFSNAPQSLQDGLERLTKNGKFELSQDSAERQQLLDELNEHLARERKKLAELREQCKKCSSGKCDEQGDGECDGKQGNGSCNKNGDGRPGKGGVSRGRGDAELTWGDEADKAGFKFKEAVLPPGFLEQPKDDILKVEKTAPTEAPAAAAARGPGREMGAAIGNSTWNRRLNPKHRDVVRKFFDSK